MLRSCLLLNMILAVSASWAGIAVAEAIEMESEHHGRAVSLRVLEERVKSCVNGRECPQEVLELAGLRWLEGYVVDPATHDLILVGHVVKNSPPLHLEDFVIAVRDAWRLYGHQKGNTFYYSDPGCSIDPQPKVIQELQRTGKYLQGNPSSAGQEEALEYWHKVCHMPQQVRVLGIPYHTHFAKVMVDADYFMKKLLDGSETLQSSKFKSLSDLHIDAMERAMKGGKQAAVSTESMSRFWFHAGQAVLLDDPGMVEIKQVPVELLTEQEHLSKKGQIVGSGHPDPLANQWAESFTRSYRAIAKEHSIYRELENLYRFVALARSMKEKRAMQSAGLDLATLIQDFQVPETQVASTLPGHSNVRTERYSQAVVNGYAASTVTMPSCGGVDAGVDITAKSFSRDRSKQLAHAVRAVLGARKDPAVLYWDF